MWNFSSPKQLATPQCKVLYLLPVTDLLKINNFSEERVENWSLIRWGSFYSLELCREDKIFLVATGGIKVSATFSDKSRIVGTSSFQQLPVNLFNSWLWLFALDIELQESLLAAPVLQGWKLPEAGSFFPALSHIQVHPVPFQQSLTCSN